MKTRFTELQIRLLEASPNINHASEKSITYAPDFKLKAVKAHKMGKGPKQIFVENGFNPKLIGSDTSRTMLESVEKVL